MKAYAYTFASFLLNRISSSLDIIDKIILFGSVAKGEATRESDVDLFINVRKKNKSLEQSVADAVDEFYKSREATLFRLEGISNAINPIIGKLDDFLELQRSIISTGIILWSVFEAATKPSSTNHEAIMYWEKIGKNRGAFLNTLYGFKVKEKRYAGFLERYGGRRIGKSCIIIPIKYREDIVKLFKKYKVQAASLEAWVG